MAPEVQATEPLLPSAPRFSSIFRHPVSAIALGIVLPLSCLLVDPIVFRTSFGVAILGEHKIAGYGVIALSTFALALWLSFGRFPSLFCGFLAAGCLASLVLGVALLPMSIMGLALVIGIFGFSPFFTAVTYGFCAKHAREVAGSQFKLTPAVLAFAVLLTLPMGTQAYVSGVQDYWMAALIDGPDDALQQAVDRLEGLGPLLDPDVLVWRYHETGSEVARARLASAYFQLTGEDIRVRLGHLLD